MCIYARAETTWHRDLWRRRDSRCSCEAVGLLLAWLSDCFPCLLSSPAWGTQCVASPTPASPLSSTAARMLVLLVLVLDYTLWIFFYQIQNSKLLEKSCFFTWHIVLGVDKSQDLPNKIWQILRDSLRRDWGINTNNNPIWETQIQTYESHCNFQQFYSSNLIRILYHW